MLTVTVVSHNTVSSAAATPLDMTAGKRLPQSAPAGAAPLPSARRSLQPVDHIFAVRNSQVATFVAPPSLTCARAGPGFAMFFVIGEFLVCCFIVIGSVLLHKAHAKVSDGIFLSYIAFVLLNYFVVRWRHERLKYKVRKFKKKL